MHFRKEDRPSCYMLRNDYMTGHCHRTSNVVLASDCGYNLHGHTSLKCNLREGDKYFIKITLYFSVDVEAGDSNFE